MNIKETATQMMIDIANDNSHGYSQSVRWGPSYDCSSLVIYCYTSALNKAGKQGPKDFGATYTGNMFSAFLEAGFEDVTSKVSLATGGNLEYGDVLLNVANHTAVFIGNGKIVHARSAEGTSDTQDNSGNEIRTQSYWNYPWDKVLRFPESTTATTTISQSTNNVTTTATKTSTATSQNFALVNVTSRGVAAIQGILKYYKYNLGWYGIDGDSGDEYSYTNTALRNALTNGKITKDEINKLLEIK